MNGLAKSEDLYSFTDSIIYQRVSAKMETWWPKPLLINLMFSRCVFYGI